jgi:uncharacterized Zn finger protein (UPF0148 family)
MRPFPPKQPKGMKPPKGSDKMRPKCGAKMTGRTCAKCGYKAY